MPFLRYFLVVLLSILLSPFASKAQKDSFIIRTSFVNQGQQEDYWAEKFFYEKYQKEVYQKYVGQVHKYNNTTFGFDRTVILLLNYPKKLTSLFKTGLLYPSLFIGSTYYQDTLKIDALEELQFLKLPPTKKRFRLWLYPKGPKGMLILNPNVYLFELTNEHASTETNLETFLQTATLTFLKKGWRIL